MCYPDDPVDFTIYVRHSRDWLEWDYIIEDCLGHEVIRHNHKIPNWPLLNHTEIMAIHGENMSSLLKSALEKQQSSRASVNQLLQSSFAAEFPTLTEFMTCTSLDGKPRQTSTLYVFVHEGNWKAFLNDRQTQRCLTVTAESFAELPVALEAILNADDPGWREMSQNSTRRPKK